MAAVEEPRPKGKGKGRRGRAARADADMDWRRPGTDAAAEHQTVAAEEARSWDRWSGAQDWSSSWHWSEESGWAESSSSTAGVERRRNRRSGHQQSGANKSGDTAEAEAEDDRGGQHPEELRDRRSGRGAKGKGKVKAGGGGSAGKRRPHAGEEPAQAAVSGSEADGLEGQEPREGAARGGGEAVDSEAEEEQTARGPIGPRMMNGNAKGSSRKGAQPKRQGAAVAKGKGDKGPTQSQSNGNKASTRRIEAALAAATTVTERLSTQFAHDAYECMICICKIGRTAQIWSCNNCWASFHLKCIRSWIERSNGTEGNNSSGLREFAWQCPGCRYHRVGALPDYSCFCGKLMNPEPSPHWLTHSCGEVCGRDRGCGHRCPELCHPGPCPPCSVIGPPGSCHCGREHRTTTRCGDPTHWSCGATCDRLLPCGLHKCPLRCHSGPCPPCAATSKQHCHCEAEVQQRVCGSESFSCGNICGKWLQCGKHTCRRVCHSGDCGPCPRDPVLQGDRCACGKTAGCFGPDSRGLLVRRVMERSLCSDPLPLCTEICSRVNAQCGHRCRRTCHEDECGPCQERVQRECRCHKTRKDVVCSEVSSFLCKQSCKTMKTCGKHRCDVQCCPGVGDRGHDNHFCLIVCGKPLSCGIHSCEDFCHLGKCKPCSVVQHDPLYCACGATCIEPPVRCGTQPPRCDRPCGAELPCGHVCRMNCHFGEHQLCFELVSRFCLGGHRELHNQPCHIGAISCGQQCGRALPCGHSCTSGCHAGDCPPCSQVCGAPRVHCEHRCEATCHFGSDCPDLPCRKKFKVSCPCGLRVDEKLCGAYSRASRTILSPLKCGTQCQQLLSRREAAAPGPSGKPRSTTGASTRGEQHERYAADLYRLGQGSRPYVSTLEEFFSRALQSLAAGATARVSLPPCERGRRLLAVEYARMHWHLRTACRKDVAENWWLVTIEAQSSSVAPKPMLSEVLALDAAASAPYRTFELDAQPQLIFTGIKDAGDEVYDLLMNGEGFIGIRPGRDANEVLAFFDRSVQATAAYRHLTGQQAPSLEPVAVRTALGKPYAALRVVLQQAFSSAASAAKPRQAAGPGFSAGTAGQKASSKPAAEKASVAASAHPATEAVPDSWEEEVPDSWEEAVD